MPAFKAYSLKKHPFLLLLLKLKVLDVSLSRKPHDSFTSSSLKSSGDVAVLTPLCFSNFKVPSVNWDLVKMHVDSADSGTGVLHI